MLSDGPTAAEKIYLSGTHRVLPPDATVRRTERFMGPMGITRLADITGLDVIGIPVVQAVRPNSRSISVSQGKGLDLDSAKASALMESIETYHAERVDRPLLLGTWAELRCRYSMADVTAIPRAPRSRFHAHARILWIQGTNMIDGEPMIVPHEAVHTDFTVPPPAGAGCFAMTSNGLASGNHMLEAVSHGLCEVIERDAHTLWALKDEDDAATSRVELASIDDPGCCELLRRYADAHVDVAVWDVTSDVGIATFAVAISERGDSGLRPVFGAEGYGCHPSREVALARALTEAAQSRLTNIAGSRDDKTRTRYAYALSSPVRRTVARSVEGPATRSFTDVPTAERATLDQDVAWELERLAAVGLRQVVCVDLTRAEFGVPVVRVVVPGLELAAVVDGVRPGARAQAVMAGPR